MRMRELHGLYAVSPQMEELFVKLKRAARGDRAVLIVGEPGTGKQRIARAIHAESPRGRGRFRAVSCAGQSPTLLESELFGHVKGAFPGAACDQIGMLRAAHRGTVLLDKVAELPHEVQGKLLRVLEDGAFVPVGATAPVRVDVRIVSTSSRSLLAEVVQRGFREDLCHRLGVVTLHVPPLREREGDVDALFWHFVGQLNRLGVRRIETVSSEVLDCLGTHGWPGNVRELRNVVAHAFALGDGPRFELSDLPSELRSARPARARGAADGLPGVEEGAERDRISAALRDANGRIGEAATTLGISRQALWRKLFVHGLR